MTPLERNRIEEQKALFSLALLVYKVLDIPSELCTGAWIEMPGTLPCDLVDVDDPDERNVWYAFEYDGNVWQLRQVIRYGDSNSCHGYMVLPRPAVEYLMREKEPSVRKLVEELVEIYDRDDLK